MKSELVSDKALLGFKQEGAKTTVILTSTKTAVIVESN